MALALQQAINKGTYGDVSPPGAAKREPGAKPLAKSKQSSTTTADKKQPKKVPAPASTKKSQDRILVLYGPENLKAWTEQTKRMATREGCLDDLLHNQQLDSPSSPGKGSYYSEDYWHRKQRRDCAHLLVIDRITPGLFAYMRVLGYNEMAGKHAADAFVFAQRAASRMHVAELRSSSSSSGCVKQSEEEVERMMVEYVHMRKEHYPRGLDFAKAKEWLGRMLVLRAPTHAGARMIVEDTISSEDRRRMEARLGIGEAKKRKHTDEANACSSVGDEASDGTEASVVVQEERRAKRVRIEESCRQSTAPVSTDGRVTSTRQGDHGLPRRPKPVLRVTTLPLNNISGFRDEKAQASRTFTDPGASPLPSRDTSVDTGLLTPREVKHEPPSP